RREIASQGAPVAVHATGCSGMCYADVQVTWQRAGRPDVTWNRVTPAETPTLVALAAGGQPAAPLPDAFVWTPEPRDALPGVARIPFLAGQRRVLLEPTGRVRPADADAALLRGGYRGLARALALPPDAVSAEVEQAGLGGRGGAYFPAARKWAL